MHLHASTMIVDLIKNHLQLYPFSRTWCPQCVYIVCLGVGSVTCLHVGVKIMRLTITCKQSIWVTVINLE